jgi:hypothetical protein
MSEILNAAELSAKQRHRPYRILIAFICGVIFFTDVGVFGMYDTTEKVLTKWYDKHGRLNRRTFKPDIGLPLISPSASHLIGIVRKEKLKEFAISPALYADPLALQRITEGAWPAKLDPSSKHYFMLPSEQPQGDCIIRAFTEAVMYVACK